MIWRFSDGTTVELGGNVEGPSLFAQELRECIARGDQRVDVWPPPDGWVDLNVNDPAILDLWLERKRDVFGRVRDVLIQLRSRPEGIPALPDPPWMSEPAPTDDAIH
jgi:hypothetical protein